MSMVSTKSARRLASRFLPDRVKRSIKSGPAGGLIRAVHRINAQITTRGLSPQRIFEQPVEHAQAASAMSVVVPIHDAPQVTERCLLNLERFASQAEIILVNDASRMPATREIIREFSSRNGWRVLSNTQATGHSRATGTGAHLASRPYLCLLNSDTVVTPWCWLPVLEVFESDARVGVAGPSTSRSGTQQALRLARDCRFEWNDNQICGYADRLRRAVLLRPMIDLAWIGGFALFIRRSLWQELGGFNQNLADYGNEIELCKRVAQSGYRAVWCKRAYIHHFAAQSYKQVLPQHEIERRRMAGAQYARQVHE